MDPQLAYMNVSFSRRPTGEQESREKTRRDKPRAPRPAKQSTFILLPVCRLWMRGIPVVCDGSRGYHPPRLPSVTIVSSCTLPLEEIGSFNEKIRSFSCPDRMSYGFDGLAG